MTRNADPVRPSLPSRYTDFALETFRWVAVAWLLLVGLWSAPSPGALLPYPNGLPAVEVGLAVVLVLLARRGRAGRLRDYPLLLPCLAVFALSLAAAACRTLSADVPFDVLRLWQTGEPMARGALLYAAVVGHPALGRFAWVALLAGLAAPALASVVQHLQGITRWYADLDAGWAGGWHPVRGLRPQGLSSYINLNAALLAAALPCWIMPLLSGARPVRARLLLLAGAGLTMAACWFTNSRGSALAFGVVVVGSALIFRTQALRARGRVAWLVVLGAVLVLGAQAYDVHVLRSPLGWRLADMGLTDTARQLIYRDALAAASRAPLWGIGDAGVAARFDALPDGKLRALPATQRNAHNQALQWAAAEGVPVATAFSLLVIGTVAWCLRRTRAQRAPFPRVFGWSVTLALAIFLLTNIPEAHFWRMEGAGFFWSLLGLFAGMSDPPPGGGRPGALTSSRSR